MSGEYRRTVTLNQSQYDQLQRAERELRTVNSNMPYVIEGIRRETAENLRRGLEPFEARQRNHERRLDALGNRMRDHERHTQDLLRQHQREFRNAVDSLQTDLNHLSEWTQAEFKRQRSEYRRLLDEQKRQLQQEIEAVELRVDNLEEREHRRRILAEAWIEDAAAFARHIETTMQHERFAPGALAKCENTVQMARENLALDAAQTALGHAQQACTELSELRINLEFLEEEWHVERAKAFEAVRILEESLNANTHITARDADGAEVPSVTVDVDYWTTGKLQALKAELKALLPRVQREDSGAATGELREISSRIVPEIHSRIECIVREARIAVISAQQRYDIARLLAESLEGQGFALDGDDCFYQQDDERQASIARLRRLDGAEVAIRVVPVDLGRNELEIHSFDHDQITEHQLNARQNELCDALQSRVPVELGPGWCSAQEPNRGLIRDVEQAVRMRS